MRWLVDVLYLIVAIALAPIVTVRAWTTGKYRTDWRQRLGGSPALPTHPVRVWFHAVSVGEVNAVRGLVEALVQARPDIDVVISTTTDTGIARARQVFADHVVFRYPLDFSGAVRQALDRIGPAMIVLVELEVWYQFVTQAAAREIPVIVVNGRLSERSARRYGWIRPFTRRMFGALAAVAAQDATYAERFVRLGVPADRVTVTGSMKWDTAQVVDMLPGVEALAQATGLASDRATWVAGSTGPGEEEVILEAWRQLRAVHPGLQLVLVPRKPERFDEVAELIVRHGWECIRRSGSPDGTMRPPSETAVVLGDTMGELRKFYLLADVAFVGRSLTAMGGSDTMEVAALARPIVVGPHNENFAETTAQFQAERAIRVLSADLNDPRATRALAEAVGDLLNHPHEAAEMAGRARQVVLRNRGAIARTLALVTERLPRAEYRAS